MRKYALCVGVLALLGMGCPKPEKAAVPPKALVVGAPTFVDITKKAGLDFIQSHGGCGLMYFVEQVASGAALFDANGDGNLDAYFPQPKPIGACVGKVKGDFKHRLYLGDGKGGFTLSPDAFGGVQTDYGIGAAAADYDNDGKLDLYVSCFGQNKLFHNKGNGTFEDVTAKAGVAVGGFSTGAVWFDYDGDGKLDLYALRYCIWDIAHDQSCYGPNGQRDSCNPHNYVASTNKLFHNNGDGTFTDVTAKSGAAPEKRRSLSAVPIDIDEDGKLDLFVANDLGPNYLLHNNGNGTFTDQAIQLGVAFGVNNNNQANMGIAVGDYNATGRLSLLVTTFANEPYTLYQNDGGLFSDVSEATGIAAATRPFLAFGTGFIDTRNTGVLDLFFANGHVSPFSHMTDATITYKERNQLLVNDGTGNYTERKESLPADDVRVHRGTCFGDVDNDGRVDILVTATNDRPTLLHNETTAGNWLLLNLITKDGCASAVGARASATVGGKKLLRVVISGGSYGGESDRRLHFGLGSATKVEQLEIKWLSGKTQRLKDITANQVLTVHEEK